MGYFILAAVVMVALGLFIICVLTGVAALNSNDLFGKMIGMFILGGLTSALVTAVWVGIK